jgi:uncharacterized DUF497 family protein
MAPRYSFDPAKNASNLRKHGVSLADADGVLSDPLAITISVRRPDPTERRAYEEGV